MEIENKAGLAATWGLIALSAFTLPALSGCADSAPHSNEAVASARMPAPERMSTRESRLHEVHDVGNGVYVFPTDKYFAETLSDFMEKHPDLKLVSVSNGPDVTYYQGDSTHSRSDSQIVVFEQVRK